MLYGSEKQTLNRSHANKLLATEMDYWRRAARKSRMEKLETKELEI